MAKSFFLSCGKDLRLARNLTFHDPYKIIIGDHVYVGHGSMILATDFITIDDEVMFGPYCVAISGNHTKQSGSYRFGTHNTAPISIGKGSWIGAHVVLTAGSCVGRGSVIAAGAVVTEKLPDDVMCGGIPAKIINTIK